MGPKTMLRSVLIKVTYHAISPEHYLVFSKTRHSVVIKPSSYQMSTFHSKTCPISCNLEVDYQWFCHIQFLIIFPKTKKDFIGTKTNNYVTRVLAFHLCRGVSTYLRIWKCIWKWLQMDLEIFEMHSCQMWTLHSTFTVPEAHDTNKIKNKNYWHRLETFKHN